ncbi:hypothetical protein AB4Z48_07955 [Cupriavidus sp. 2TAF22]|uniref:hypothetical protein n=1 Tax=unclassified Cupriavidus TaxID=2640874 RepID=UPI003F923DEB
MEQDSNPGESVVAPAWSGNLLEFLAWVEAGPRTFEDTMDAWRTSCPRLSAWEDATAAGLVGLDLRPGLPRAQAIVHLTARGRAALREPRLPASACGPAANPPDRPDRPD